MKFSFALTDWIGLEVFVVHMVLAPAICRVSSDWSRDVLACVWSVPLTSVVPHCSMMPLIRIQLLCSGLLATP